MLRNTVKFALSLSLITVACDDDISFRASATGDGGSTGSDSESDSESDGESDGDTSYPTVCGDGMVDFDEDCDDGNMVNNDSCTNMCTVPAAPPACNPLGNPAVSDEGASAWVQTQDHLVQTFTPCDALDLAYVMLPLRTCSDNGSVALTLELRATKMDGTPADEVIETFFNTSSDVIDNCSGGPFQDTIFKFYSEPHLNAGATYALVLKASPIAPDTDSYGLVEWQRNYDFNPNPYALGTYWHRYQWGNWITAWTGNNNYDLNFKLGEL